MSNPKTRPEVKIDESDISEELKVVVMTLQDLTYDGFSAVKVRQEVNVNLSTKEVLTLTSAYCQIGNNVERAMGKVVNQRKDISPLLKKSGVSLARIGLAYPALVRAIRAAYSNQLGRRIAECKTPSDFQDPACAPYHPDGRDFHEKFSKLIFNPDLAKVGIDYFAIAVANRDQFSEPLMKLDLAGIIKEMKAGRY